MKSKDAIIIGAGPAGLTAAYSLLERGGQFHPIVLEASDAIGGISRTVCHKGNRMDIGGHRFFSKSDRVNALWQKIMPLDEDVDPQTTDRVMLHRPRVSRIYYRRRFFDYPVSLSLRTIRNLGVWNTLCAGMGYLRSRLLPLPEDSLENFYINRFGRPLYSMFFEDYTEKVWGVHPSHLGADWGSQRVKGLSITAILRDMLLRALHIADKHKETSLIESFIYPKYGPGQLWESMASDITEKGGEVRKEAEVTAINIGADRRVESVEVTYPDGTSSTLPCSCLFSSMPLKDLVAAIRGIDVPGEVREIARTLPYRDFITVGLLVSRLAITSKEGTLIPDTWIYIQEKDVRVGRLQVFNNWSPYMVAYPDSTVWIGLEYFCNEGDDLWQMADEEFISMAIEEMVKTGIIGSPDDVVDATRIRVKKAYPAYHGSYYRFDRVRDFLDSIPNLYCIGRNGQHRYNNMDHSMLTAIEAVDCAINGRADRSAVWNVNTEDDYHEQHS